MYFVELSVKANKFLTKLDKQLEERIKTKLKMLENIQVPSDAKFIGRHNGDKVFRVRIGDYRALYKVIDKERIVLVTKIDKRPRIYQR